MPTVTTTASALAATGLIQNLGPDEIFLGESGVTSGNGFRVSSGEAVAVGNTNAALYAVSAGTSDVRFLGRATGIFPIITS